MESAIKRARVKLRMIYERMEMNDCIILVFLDFEKVFDIVN